MNGDYAEISDYLYSLLEHGSECNNEDCPSCRTLYDLLEVIRNRLFDSPLYPSVMAASASSRQA